MLAANAAIGAPDGRMDLKSGYPFWPIRDGLIHSFPALERDLDCAVAIVGGGLTAALIARELTAHGHQTVVLERRDFGWGSTAASTAMLQYEIDTHLTELTKLYGATLASRAYRACAEAIDQLAAVAKQIGRVDFVRRESLYFASSRRDLTKVRAEFESRARIGLPVRWLTSGEIAERYGFKAPGAILSTLGATADPYRFAIRLFMALEAQGVGVYDRTTVERVHTDKRHVRLDLHNGGCVRAQRVIFAAGYETQRWVPERVAKNRSSYAYVTDPMAKDALGELARAMVWESARPYLYLRPTTDGRLIAGGEDDAIDIPARRDRRVQSKARKLRRKLEKLRPDLVAEPAFAWGGTFAETKDGLPYFGPHPKGDPRVLYAMAFGGNGTTYSMSGAALLRAWIEGRKHPLRDIYGFARADLQC